MTFTYSLSIESRFNLTWTPRKGNGHKFPPPFGSDDPEETWEEDKDGDKAYDQSEW